MLPERRTRDAGSLKAIRKDAKQGRVILMKVVALELHKSLGVVISLALIAATGYS